MRSKMHIGAAVAVVLFSATAFAQNPPPRAAPAPIAPMTHAGEWRSSKLIGLNVYNMQNEKVGDINEILVHPSGKVTGFVVGVGGFLGMGEHDVFLTSDQLKFLNEPVRTSGSPPNTTGTGTPARPTRAANERWYPDHAVINGTKEQLKAMPQFKYSN